VVLLRELAWVERMQDHTRLCLALQAVADRIGGQNLRRCGSSLQRLWIFACSGVHSRC
jgi:hypothetical protein